MKAATKQSPNGAVTVKQAAEALGVEPITVYEWLRAGLAPSVKDEKNQARRYVSKPWVMSKVEQELRRLTNTLEHLKKS